MTSLDRSLDKEVHDQFNAPNEDFLDRSKFSELDSEVRGIKTLIKVQPKYIDRVRLPFDHFRVQKEKNYIYLNSLDHSSPVLTRQ